MDHNCEHALKTAQAVKPVSKGLKLLRRLFPWAASGCIIWGIANAAFAENAAVTKGSYVLLPYLLMATIMCLSLAADYFLYRDR